jgi:hypothetical protein
MQYKPIKIFHVENAILGKDFNLGVTSSFFHAFIHMGKFEMGQGSNQRFSSYTLGDKGYPLIFG